MTQSHNCAYLVSPGDQCRCDESCQYMLTTYNRPCGPMICGKDQLTGHDRGNDPRIDALIKRIDAVNADFVSAMLEVNAAKDAIRENIVLKEALADMQVELQHERGSRADMEWEYRGKVDDILDALGHVGTEYAKKSTQYDNLSDENAALRKVLKAVL